jgi:hypothetical protein
VLKVIKVKILELNAKDEDVVLTPTLVEVYNLEELGYALQDAMVLLQNQRIHLEKWLENPLEIDLEAV